MRDAAGSTDQVADEAFQIVDNASLVGQYCIGLGLLDLDAAADAGHEGLRVVGQAFEHPHQVAQGGMHLGGIRHGLVG